MKKECLGGLVPVMDLPGGGLTMFPVKKRLKKIKYGFEALISYVDLGLF